MSNASRAAAFLAAASLALCTLGPASTVRAQERSRGVPVPAPAPDLPVAIYGVEVERGNERDRVLIFGERDFRYRVVGSDPDTIEVQILHAVLDPSATPVLDPEDVGTVSRVVTREVSLPGGTEVHVAIRRTEGFAPEVTQRGAMLAVDFDRPVSSERIVLRARNTDIREVADQVARAVGMDLIIDEDLAGAVTVTSAAEISPAEAVQLLDALLLLRGYVVTATPSRALKIVPIEGAPARAPWMGSPEAEGASTLATLVRLRWADPSDVERIMKSFVDEATLVRAVSFGDGLILAGATARVERALELIALLDEARREDVMVRNLRYADAAAATEQLLEAFRDSHRNGRLDAWPARRRNDVVVRGAPELLTRARDFLARLDQPVPGQGSVRVLPVLHADPEDLAEVLRNLAEGAPPPGEVAGTLWDLAFGITVDRPTGSLLVMGEPETLRRVASVVAELDRPRPQIDVEVTIFEVSTLGDLELGFEALIPFGDPDSDIFGSVLLDPNGGGLQGAGGERSFMGRIERDPILVPVTGPGGETVSVLVPQESFVILADDTAIKTHVMMRPHLTVASGSEQELFAGDNIPVPTAQGGADGGSPFETRSNIAREDVGIRLRVRPTLGLAGDIALDIEVEDRRVARSLAGNPSQVGLTFAQRNLETSVRVASGEIVAVGMMQQSNLAEMVAGTPFLRDLPVLGSLFRVDKTRTVKRHLVIAVQARLLPGPDALLAQSIRRRLAIERRLARTRGLSAPPDAPFALLVATGRNRSAALTTAVHLRAAGESPEISQWDWNGDTRHDVYVTGFESLVAAGDAAHRLRQLGFDPQLAVLPDLKP